MSGSSDRAGRRVPPAALLALSLAWPLPLAAQDRPPPLDTEPMFPEVPAPGAVPAAVPDPAPLPGAAPPDPAPPPLEPAAGPPAPPADAGAPPPAGPVPLVPETAVEAPAAPAPAEDADEVPPAFRVPDPPAGIAVADLPDAQPDWIGVLEGSEGGLGSGMWEGTDVDLAGRLLAAIPVALSPAMRDLARRVLLSRAAAPAPRAGGALPALAPDGTPLAPEAGGGPGDFLDVRIEKLVRLADGEGLARLAAAVPPELQGPDFALRAAEARIAAGDVDAACAEVRALLAEAAEVRLRQALAACQLLLGAPEQARLTLQLLEDEGEAADAFVRTGLAVAEGLGAPPPGEGAGLLLRAVAAAGGGYDPDAADIAPLRTAAERGLGAAAGRIAAAERAVAAGALPEGALARLYAAADFADSGIRGAGEAVERLAPPEARAWLFQAASGASTAIDRARFLRLLWDSAGGPGFAALARATGAVAASIQPRADLGWFSAAAARALLAAGRHEAAERWVDLLAASPDLDFAASGELYAFFPALAIAGRPVPEPYGVFPAGEAGAALLPGGSGEGRARHLARLLVALEAVGIPVPPGAWARLLDEARLRVASDIPSAPVRYQLRDAVAGGRTAEAVLLVLVVLGPGGPAAADPLALNAAIRSLRAVGLEGPARDIALEAALSDGRWPKPRT